MARLFNIIASLSLVSTGLSARLPSDPARNRARTGEKSPCAQIASLTSTWTEHPENSGPLPAKLAYECLTSVPFNQTAALALLDDIKPFIDFQSTTATLKHPPQDFVNKVRGPYDVYKELAQVQARAARGEYKNEHEFGMELFQVFQFAHDDHFQFIPDSVGTAFTFDRGIPSTVLVSGKDNTQEIYGLLDLVHEHLGNASFKASRITHVNGQDIDSFLEGISKWTYATDLDAAHNMLFTSLPGRSQNSVTLSLGGFTGCGDMNNIYPGPSTELRFANGTTKSYQNEAYPYVDFAGIDSGEALYQKYYSTPKILSNGTDDDSKGQDQTSTPPPPKQPAGYPPPIAIDPIGILGGYYLENEYSDVAVLSVGSFDQTDDVQGFYNFPAKFTTEAKAAGKKKLIIDLSSNFGGQSENVYFLFKALFPQGREYSSTSRFKATDANKLFAEKFSQLGGKYPLIRGKSPKFKGLDTNFYTAFEYNYHTLKTPQGQAFKNVNELLSPGLTQNGDSFSNAFVSDLRNPWTFNAGDKDLYATYPKAKQPFAANDIVLVTDGLCSSSCATFVDLMRTIHNVQTVVLGGRPRPGLMQAVGGSKGPRSWPWQQIGVYTDAAFNYLSTPEELKRLQKTPLNKILTGVAYYRQAAGTVSNINFLNSYHDGPDSNTPRQFIYEPADCRILRTKDMYIDVSNVWKLVADSAWGGKNHCSAGSIHGHGKARRGLHKRELTSEEKAHSEKVQAWRRDLKPEDFADDGEARRNLARSLSSKGRKLV